MYLWVKLSNQWTECKNSIRYQHQSKHLNHLTQVALGEPLIHITIQLHVVHVSTCNL